LELVRAGHARTVEHGEDGEGALPRLGAHEPEIREVWKFLAGGGCGVDGKSARRETIGLIAAQHSEVGRAEKYHQLVLVGRRVERKVDAKARETEIRGPPRLRHERPELEHRGAVRNRPDAGRTHFEQAHAAVESESAVEELHLEQRAAGPQRARSAKAD